MKSATLLLSFCLFSSGMTADTVWHPADQGMFAIEGKLHTPSTPAYGRLPEGEETGFSELNRILGRNSAGVQLRFRTNSRNIRVRIEVEGKTTMYHITAAGQSGLDLYVYPPGQERFLATALAQPEKGGYEAHLFQHPTSEMRDFTLYLPLYNTVRTLEIGLDAEAVVEAPLPRPGPIVFYGTSITQGGCASRPGMVHTSILSRRLGYDIWNFGFSGSGNLDTAMGQWLARIPDPALYVIECEANCSTDVLQERLAPFLAELRKQHPAVPILLVSALPGRGPNPAAIAIQKTVVNATGDDKIFFLDGSVLLGKDPLEGTVDGLHLNTLGFQRYAEALEPILRKILTAADGPEESGSTTPPGQ